MTKKHQKHKRKKTGKKGKTGRGVLKSLGKAGLVVGGLAAAGAGAYYLGREGLYNGLSARNFSNNRIWNTVDPSLWGSPLQSGYWNR